MGDLKPTIRTITAFIDFSDYEFEHINQLETKLEKHVGFLREMESELGQAGYLVQTLRIATNPFGEWLNERIDRLKTLDTLLASHKIDFCSVGPANNHVEAALCQDIVSTSSRFSCSMNIDSGAVEDANLAANIILSISKLGDRPHAPAFLKEGQGNFRFCAASNCKPYIPFFPAAKSETTESSSVKFAIGLENGSVLQTMLRDVQSIGNIRIEFGKQMKTMLLPIQLLCEKVAKQEAAQFLGIDSSLNPSLEETGSVASAVECLEEVKTFGGPGTVAAASQLTTTLQSLSGIKLTGYCGLMLPVCEDTRLAQLSNKHIRQLRISDLLSISSVCGVGLDTVPIPGNASQEDIASIILDMAGVAGRWKKSLSCRLFPVPGLKSGDMTAFDSPYLVNANVFSVE